MSTMKKSDLILAQKAIAARQVKAQSKAIKEEMQTMRTTHANHSHSRGSNSNFPATSEFTLNKSSTLPNIKTSELSPTPTQMTGSMLFSPTATKSPSGMEKAYSTAHLSKDNQALVDELAQRSVTDKTQLRKLQFSVSKSLEAQRPHTTQSHSARPIATPSGSTLVNPETNRPVGDANFFMPKKAIFRPDGATLHDIYESKRQDMWGQIIKAQYKESEHNKVMDKIAKEHKNQQYGMLLTQQVQENEQRKRNSTDELNNFAALETSTAKRYEDLEKNRQEDAIRRHKQFISNALEDMQTKHIARTKELTEDMTASVIMINKAKEMIREEEMKRQREKEYQKAYSERIFQENLNDLERKQKLKEKTQEEDRRIIEENERQYQREKQRREDDLKKKMVRSTEGPAHHIVQSLVELKKERDEEFYSTLSFKSENSLNKQLRDSEEAAARRATQNGDSLNEEWVRNTELKRKKKREEEERNNKIISTMRALLQRQEEEERKRREERRREQMRYQRELDQQVREVRQRSVDNLTKTMSEQERKYNTALLQKASQFM